MSKTQSMTDGRKASNEAKLAMRQERADFGTHWLWRFDSLNWTISTKEQPDEPLGYYADLENACMALFKHRMRGCHFQNASELLQAVRDAKSDITNALRDAQYSQMRHAKTILTPDSQK